jgi:hypothetical protein
MREVGGHLHLAGHKVGGKDLFSAGDVEGHAASDNRMYLLDLARAFPPESPVDCLHLLPHQQVLIVILLSSCLCYAERMTVSPLQSVLFRLLRPELLQRLKADGFPALSPDAFTGPAVLRPAIFTCSLSLAFSGWGQHDSKTHNEVRFAHYLDPH